MKTGDVNGEGLLGWPETGNEYNYIEVADQGFVVHKGLENKVEEMAKEYVLKEYEIDKDL